MNGRKRLCALLLGALLCLLCAAALGEGAQDAFLQAHPGYTLEAMEICGDTAAAVMHGDGRRMLLIAEKQDGAWRIVIDNPTALDPDRPCPSLLMDSDIALYWTYHTESGYDMFNAMKHQGVWGAVSLIHSEFISESKSTGMRETHLSYADGRLCIESVRTDENDNVLHTRREAGLPGKWMEDGLLLANFDLSRAPHGHLNETWPGDYALEQVIRELLPRCTYVDGAADADGLRFVVRRADGKLGFAGAAPDSDGRWRIAQSMPFPEGWQASIGYENFTTALVLTDAQGQTLPMMLDPYADGTWGFSYWVNDIGQILRQNSLILPEEGRTLFGTHPWSDIAAIDWAALPLTRADILAGFDASGWATPCNPNPQDRLHLRSAPRRDAPSLGKYYNGAPVQVLAREGDWTKVDICGREGYMMTAFLAFGQDMLDIPPAVQAYFLRQEKESLFAVPEAYSSYDVISVDPTVIGVLGSEWLHVWYPETGQSGFMRADALHPGNG